jgi:hypothetical protein
VVVCCGVMRRGDIDRVFDAIVRFPTVSDFAQRMTP